MVPPARPPDESVRALAESILSQHRYAQWRSTDSELLERIFDWIGRTFSWTAQLRVESPVLFALFVAALLGVALVLLLHVVWSIRAALATTGPAPSGRRAPEPHRWTEESERLAREGRFLEAAHRLVLGSIDVLVERGVIELGRADANRVLRDRIRRSPLPMAASERFLALLDAFEERWFRDRVEDGALYRDWRELHAQLAEGARGPA